MKLVLKSAVLVMLAISITQAGQMIVRVQAKDYWQLYDHIPFKGTSIDIAGVVPGESYDLVLDRADLPVVEACGLEMDVIVSDLEKVREKAWAEGQYHSYDQLVTIMRNLAVTYPSICVLDSFGTTYEGRWVIGLKISDNPTIDEDEPELLWIGLHHSREWAAAEVPRYIADTLITNYATNSTFQDFIDNHELWIFPVINPDGYTYDYPNQRNWRKDRQPFGGIIGTDPNRDYNGVCNGNRMGDWGSLVHGSRTTHKPSQETFFGAYGAYGKEIHHLTEFFKQRTIVACESYHSYSQLVIWPYGHGEQTPDNSYYASLGTQIANRIAKLSGGHYTPQQSNHLYPTNCGSDDWMYGWGRTIGGFPCMSYTVELGTRFYQPVGDLDKIQREAFKGAFYHMQQSDNIIANLEGMVPRPILAVMDSSMTGDFTIHWTMIKPEYNHPDKWELEELTGLSVITDDIESGSSHWTLQGFSVSTSQHHSGTHSLFSGSSNNISNYAVTKDPYPVQSGDSLVFWVWYDLETDYDVGVAEVSLEGKEWIQLHERYTGNSGGWQRKAYSLEPWIGKSVFIRFRSMTDDGTLRTGMFVDDISPVPLFDNHTVISSNITDTLYEVTGKDPGTYYYRVRGRNVAWNWGDMGPLEDIRVTGSGVASKPAVKFETKIHRLEPNPAVCGLNIHYSLGRSGLARLAVYDASGRLVRMLFYGCTGPGEYSMHWNGHDQHGNLLPAGVYYCRLSAEENLTQRFVLMR